MSATLEEILLEVAKPLEELAKLMKEQGHKLSKKESSEFSQIIKQTASSIRKLAGKV